MASGIYSTIIYLLGLTFKSDVLWIVFPLFVSTIVLIIYSEKYKDERQSWSTYLTNSLVLLFVSMSLFRYIYSSDIYQADNFLAHAGKSIATVFLLFFGFIMLRFNFEHVLPEKITKVVSSTLTVNLLAYTVILFVYSEIQATWIVYVSLLIILVIFSIVFNLLKLPLNGLFIYTKKLKEKEKIDRIKEDKYEISQLKEQLKQKKNLTTLELKELEKQKKEAIKLKKIIKK